MFRPSAQGRQRAICPFFGCFQQENGSFTPAADVFAQTQAAAGLQVANSAAGPNPGWKCRFWHLRCNKQCL
jgi:hypothetical protein